MQSDLLIIGGGLSGLYAASRLQAAGRRVQVLEARERLGGRILSQTFGTGPDRAVFDLGPAWVWPDFQPRVADLLRVLALPTFPQYVSGDVLYEDGQNERVQRFQGPAPDQGSRRLVDGATALIDALARRLDPASVHLGLTVQSLRQQADHIEVIGRGANGERRSWQAVRVLLAMPPRLVARQLTFEPGLPADMLAALAAVPTWMAGHAKVLAVYEQAFWRDEHLSGHVSSRRGPVVEMHDASPRDGGPYALFGFIGYSAQARRAMGEASLRDAVLAQLGRLFGPVAQRPLELIIKDWSDDACTATADDQQAPASHPRYGLPQAVQQLWGGRVRFIGTEAAEEHGGYIEGALEAVDNVLPELIARD